MLIAVLRPIATPSAAHGQRAADAAAITTKTIKG